MKKQLLFALLFAGFFDFKVPINDANFNTNQARIYTTDFDALVQGVKGEGVVTGCAVTAQGSPDMTVAVAAGTVKIAGALVTVSSGNVTITTANAIYPRIDIVVVNSSGTKSVTAGAATTVNTVMPAIPASSVILAAVYVPANDTAIATAQITDKKVPVQSSGRMLLESHTAASSSTLDFTTRNQNGFSGATFQSDYRMYEVVLDELIPSTNTDLLVTASTNGGSSYLASTTYRYCNRSAGSDAAVQTTSSNGDSSIILTKAGTSTTLWRTDAGTALYGELTLFGFPSSASNKMMRGGVDFTTVSSISLGIKIDGQITTTTAVNAIRFAPAAGNIVSGVISVFGVQR